MSDGSSRGTEVGAEALVKAASAVQTAVRVAATGLVEREVLVELIALAAIAEEHLLVIGEPGTAKSEAVRRVARAIGGRYFEYLLGRFTEPSELFGPVDLLKLQQGRVETQTAGMLPEADVAFLDEVFLGSTAILNTLLAILNERRFRRGHSAAIVPLRLCVGASNALPDDVALAAFADRFLVRVFLAPVADAQLEALLAAGIGAATSDAPQATLANLDLLARARRAVDLTRIAPLIAQAVRLLRRAGIALTDRRIVRSQSLIAAAAALDGRLQATAHDLWPLVYAVPTAVEQDTARDVLRELLSETQSSLKAAAFDASASPLARAQLIADRAEPLLAETPVDGAREPWKLRLEGVLREIDASFAPTQLPEPLAAVRAQITRLLE
jgi:MoxR-like ATPase